ncbi:alanine--tRNA ligase [Anaerotalea alkaliphila]|uniref:Alanine--tRNA ligase n=1 Tax=Anaerotalea alkaliphila TaxID=2662126 RepID=A0A7X5KNL6_9FIRM|nr:alanine--tRNA ligase [Anaerotalea alkaliphila]NDL68159.1 alanine--tRNA ligase [Anaerotalea alkaliphila]
MKSYGVNELRDMYLKFFEGKGHLRANSFPLVPKNDKSLLLVNSGMAPLKPYFTGQEVPPSKRMTTCQKCIRTGDIENVGKTARHGTFFEMLGNFSFGDYFKKEAIAWAWEFFTEVLQVPKERLYVSVYEEDDEAEQIWHQQEKVPMDRIVRMGKADNFWEHGAGPCGPCSEIYFDRGPKYGCDSPDCFVGCDCDRFVEVWNLVFTQFEKTEDGRYVPLDNPNIDTGMGLERLAVMMQDVDSIFDVDTIRTLRDAVCAKAGVAYHQDPKTDISIRLITDHIRSVTFMTSDGILPSNEGRGYVLRRLLRRAARHGRLIGIKDNFIASLSQVVIQTSKDGYPELEEKRDYILKVLTMEEDRFSETIDQGLSILKSHIEEQKAAGAGLLTGSQAFKLYDTFGFPTDLTVEIAEESGLTVDMEGFRQEMEAQRVRAREARAESNYMGSKETVYNQLDVGMQSDFVGYASEHHQSPVLALTSGEALVDRAVEGDTVSVFVAETPFYATSGGQLADTGRIETANGAVVVEDVYKVVGGKIAHHGYVESGEIRKGDLAELTVDRTRRHATAKNHSATHLLQKALKKVLGNHVEQAGSSVNPERLRFDFTHFAPLTEEELALVETDVNEQIMGDLDVDIREMPVDEAKKMGAMALFGEKYGDTVRVVRMGDYSIELCGGTHIHNTSEIGLFKIVSETGVAAGVRRIEALTSHGAIDYYKEQEALVRLLASRLKTEPAQLPRKLDALQEDLRQLRSENESLKSKLAQGAASGLLANVKAVGGLQLLAAQVDNVDSNGLRELGDHFKQKLQGGVVVLASGGKDAVSLLVMASDEAVKAGAHAGNIVKEAAKIVGGGGGGRPQMAQAGGKDPARIEEALRKAEEVLLAQIQG